ncbi:MAG: hypothetical protein C4534_11165 [Gaiellales bacterium]|nr:MAG: hypothetical protein C4534_11165 [Gaiellales bacterium]
MRFRIGEVYSDSVASIRKSPTVLLPAVMTVLAPLLLGLLFYAAGSSYTGPYLHDGSRQLDSDEFAVFGLFMLAFVILSVLFYAWMTQVAAAAVREGAVSFRGALRLIGPGTLRVVLSEIIIGLIFLGAGVIYLIIMMSAGDSNASVVASAIITVALMIAAWAFFSLVPTACAYENIGPVKSLSAGTAAARPAFWSMVGFLVVTALGIGAVTFLAGIVAWAFGTGDAAMVASMVIDGAVNVATTTFFALALTHVYAWLRRAPDGETVREEEPPGFSEYPPVL